MRKDKKLFFILSIVMGVVVISSNYLVQFPVNVFNLESILTYGAFSYPVAFLITAKNAKLSKKVKKIKASISAKS